MSNMDNDDDGDYDEDDADVDKFVGGWQGRNQINDFLWQWLMMKTNEDVSIDVCISCGLIQLLEYLL